MSETDNSEQIVNKPGKPWTNVGVFDSYETAKNQLMHLIAAAPTYDYKIKRSGDRGSKCTIKSRLNPELDKANQKMEESLRNSREKSSNKKSKKSS